MGKLEELALTRNSFTLTEKKAKQWAQSSVEIRCQSEASWKWKVSSSLNR